MCHASGWASGLHARLLLLGAQGRIGVGGLPTDVLVTCWARPECIAAQHPCSNTSPAQSSTCTPQPGLSHTGQAGLAQEDSAKSAHAGLVAGLSQAGRVRSAAQVSLQTRGGQQALPLKISGAVKAGVPANSLRRDCRGDVMAAKPKSATLTRPWASMRTFSPLRSLCMHCLPPAAPVEQSAAELA